MYGLRSDRILRYFRCIGCEDEGSQLCIGAETGCNALGVANCVLDSRLLVLSCIPSMCLLPTYWVIWILVSSYQGLILPFEDDYADKRIAVGL
jgi:hypothetical protein